MCLFSPNPHWQFFLIYPLSEKLRNVLINDLLPIRKRWYIFVAIDPVLQLCENFSEDVVYDYYLHDTFSDLSVLLDKFQTLSILLQMSICRKMFGDIRKVCKA